MVEAVEGSTVVEEVSMAAEDSVAAVSMEAEAALGDITVAAMADTTAGLSVETTEEGTVGRTVVIAVDRAMLGEDLAEGAARSVECAAPGPQDHGHLTGAAASAVARPGGTRFREEATQEACPLGPVRPEWRAGLERPE